MSTSETVDAEHWRQQYREIVREQELSERHFEDTRRALAAIVAALASSLEDNRELEAEASIVSQLLKGPWQIDELTQQTGRVKRVVDQLLIATAPDPAAVDAPDPIAMLVANIVERTAIQTEPGALTALDRLNSLVETLLARFDSQSARLLEVERFLGEVQTALAQLEGFVDAVGDDVADGRSAGDLLQNDVAATVDAMSQHVAGSEDLAELKSQVREGIEALTRRMASHQQNETARLDAAEQRNAELRDQLVALEQRTSTLEQELAEQSAQLLSDALTGVHSRLALQNRIREEISRHHRQDEAMCYTIWDIDHFKAINDTHGHPAGDAILREVAQTLQRYTRTSDFVARLGGEEFVVLLPATDKDNALIIADKLRELIAAGQFQYEEAPISVTISCGLAMLNPDDDPESLYQRADRSLYAAKQSGRNCCRIEDTTSQAA